MSINQTDNSQDSLGRYGRLRKAYLKTHNRGIYTYLLLSATLDEHLLQIEREASCMMERLSTQLARQAGATESLKAADQLAWVGIVNNARSAAEEAVLRELVYR